MNRRLPGIGAVLLLSAALGMAQVAAQSGSLTGAPQIARVYDAILDARFDEVPGLLEQTCNRGGPATPAGLVRPHPAVCQLLEVVSLWWQIQLDPLDPSRDAEFGRKADAVIAETDAWTRAEPGRAEAWFYLGGAYGARGQWRVLRGQTFAAVRDGKRIKDALERSLALDPNLKDAYFGIGLYHYYADVAPTAAKILRFLLFLPGGNKEQGMREMLEARNSGQLLRSEADYQLHVLYLWYEHEPLRALELITGLRGRHPRNPHFPQVIAEINDAYLHDDTASLRAWQDMLDAAREKRLNVPSMAEARARLGIATQLERLFESDAALAQLQAVIQAAPTAPFGAVAQATLRRAQSLDRLGLRPDAVAGYRRAIDLAGERDPLKIAAQARSGLRTSPDAATTRAYRLSLEGWRAVERGALSDANRLLGESLALRPGDPVTQYRMARLRIAQGNTAAALAVLEQITELDPSRVPSTFYGYACFDAATILEQMNAPARAIDLYTRAIDVFGGDERTKASARRAVRRLSGAG